MYDFMEAGKDFIPILLYVIMVDSIQSDLSACQGDLSARSIEQDCTG
jgi:hypothetical protein